MIVLGDESVDSGAALLCGDLGLGPATGVVGTCESRLKEKIETQCVAN